MAECVVYNNRYRVVNKIGSGAFGEVYLGEDTKTRRRVAIKLEPVTFNDPLLRKEYEIYMCLRGLSGVPVVHWFGMEGDNRVLVMDFVGPSLDEVSEKNREQLGVNNVMKIGLRCIEVIEKIHRRGVVHRDIKPENFLISKMNKIHIVDFGLSVKYRDSSTGEHIKFRENKKLVGTPRYASINNHLGYEQSRRDDMESIGYMLIYILKGRLPWQGLKKDSGCSNKYQHILDKKLSTSIPELCEGVPDEILAYLEYTRNLKFHDTPNYYYLKSLFYNAIVTDKYLED